MPRKPLGIFLPVYLSDWRGSSFIGSLTPEEEAVFLRLLMHEWEHGSIPMEDQERLPGAIGVTPSLFRKTWKKLREAFDEGGQNESLERKREYHRKQSERRTGGRPKGGPDDD